MENTTQESYRDSPASSRSPSPDPESRPAIAKPLPSLPNDAPPTFSEAYRDEPSTSTPITAPRPQRYRAASADILNPSHHRQVLHYTPYTDAVPEYEHEHDNDDDVPLAHLYLYPTEAPPAYHMVVRESYRNPLVAHIPRNFTGIPEDEEAGFDIDRADDLQFSVEKVVAGLIVSMVLLLVTVLLVWHILSFYL